MIYSYFVYDEKLKRKIYQAEIDTKSPFTNQFYYIYYSYIKVDKRSNIENIMYDYFSFIEDVIQLAE
jgi:hypothetical protein